MNGSPLSKDDAGPPRGSSSSDDEANFEEKVIGEVRHALRTIEYGSVHIQIHQGHVVTVETSTKVRLAGR